MESFTVRTEAPIDVIDLTDDVAAAIPSDAAGTATVFVQHTTAGITVNEAEPRLMDDLAEALADIVPDAGWSHDEIDDNAEAHVRAMLVGPGETVPVQDGALALGAWQSVLLVECDGPRRRTVQVIVE